MLCISSRKFPQPPPPSNNQVRGQERDRLVERLLVSQGRYVGLGIGGEEGEVSGLGIRPNPPSPTPDSKVHSLIPGAAFHPDPNLHVLPNTQNLSHLTPQMRIPQTHTHTRPCRGTDIRASLSFSLSFP